MNVFEQWSDQWFGWWYEEQRDETFPRISDYIDPLWLTSSHTLIEKYLLNCPCVFTTGTYPCVFGDSIGGSIRTDGDWIWRDDLAHYIEHHHLRLPDRFLEHMARQHFDPLPYLDLSVQNIADKAEWSQVLHAITFSWKQKGIKMLHLTP